MKERTGYDDDEAERIVARAAEIDATHRRQLDAAAIREMALDAGISPTAVERALREHELAPANRASRLKRYRAILLIVAIAAGLVLLAITRTVPDLRF